MAGRTMVLLQGNYNDLFGSPTPTPSLEGAQVQVGLSTGDSFMQLVGLVFLLIAILVAAYFTSRLVGNMKLGQMKQSNFTVIDSYRVSPNKIMQIVKIGNKFVVIAIGKDTINFITELDEAEVHIREGNAGEKLNFKLILDKLKNNNE